MAEYIIVFENYSLIDTVFNMKAKQDLLWFSSSVKYNKISMKIMMLPGA